MHSADAADAAFADSTRYETAYETLRAQALSRMVSHGRELALLVHDGMSAWIEALPAQTTAQTSVTQRRDVAISSPRSSLENSSLNAAATSLLSPQRYAEAVLLLTTVAFAARRAPYG